jgi:hypothetical protein
MIIPEFSESIERVTTRTRAHRSLYERNETATRNQVIDPILRCLGWDTEDPEKVQPDVCAEEGIPDYSLLLDGKKVLFVEAKKMSIDVEDKQVLSQLAKYCFAQGMSYGVLTNGVIWVLFRAFQEGTTMAERVVWKADIEHDDINAIARKLNTVSTTNITTIDRLLTKLAILDEVWQSLLEDPDSLTKGMLPVFLSMAKEAHPDYDLGAEEVADFIRERLNEIISPQTEYPLVPEEITPRPEGPRMMKIERDTFTVRNSYDVLVNAAEWLVKKGKLHRENCPVVSGHKRYLVNIAPKHRYGDDFRAPKKLSNGLFIETHYSTSHCIANARKLLEHCGLSGTLLEVH